MKQHLVMEKHNQIISDLLLNLDKIEDSSTKILEQMELAIGYCKKAIGEMRELVIQEGFPDQTCEIHFFKKMKPEIFSKLLYYLEVFDIQSKHPVGNQQCLIQYYQRRMDKIQEFMQEYQTEIQYFQCGFTHFDKSYFTRDSSEIPLPKRNGFFLIDEKFHTWHDLTFALIIANQRLIDFIQNELCKLEKLNCNSMQYFASTSTWSGKKVFLIELAYGIHYAEVVNGGNSEIKEIIEGFEHMFNIQLKGYYHTFLEMKRRKIDRTKFLDYMKSKLETKMDEAEQ